MKTVVLVAGTRDACELAGRLAGRGCRVVATVVTALGEECLSGTGCAAILRGRLDSAGFRGLLLREKPAALVDASHPYAREVSRNACAACQAERIPYLRYVREGGLPDDVILTPSFEEAADFLSGTRGNILLTTGSNNLNAFTAVPNYRERIYVRVLPVLESIERCCLLGFSASHILALQGPFSEAMNAAMLTHCGAAFLVTKDSGPVGGVDAKISAARTVGAAVIAIARQEREEASTIAAFLERVKGMGLLGEEGGGMP